MQKFRTIISKWIILKKWGEYNFFFIFFILAEDNFALRPEIFEQELLKLQEKGKYISHLKIFSSLYNSMNQSIYFQNQICCMKVIMQYFFYSGEKVCGIILCNPSNPLGQVYNKETGIVSIYLYSIIPVIHLDRFTIRRQV